MPFDLREFIDETVDEMKGLLKNDQLILADYKGVTMVQTDKKLLKNILINLISNAIKFSDETAIIDIKSSVNENEAEISIADKGIGISEEDQSIYLQAFSGRKM